MTVATQGASAVPSNLQATADIELARRNDFITVLLNVWMMIGLFVDLWAHGRNLLETFFTPWHALFYSGYFATAAWLVWPVVRALRAGRPGLADLRAGYALGVVGVLMFAAGGVTDMLWHTFYGIERGIEPFLSPPHILLGLGMMLTTTCPFRAAWMEMAGQRTPSFRAFLPALLSLALGASIASFFLLYLWGFTRQDSMTALTRLSILIYSSTELSARMLRELTQQEAIGSILLTNVALVAPVLLVLRRWQPPFGSVVFLYWIIGVFMGTVTGYWYLPLLVVTGLIADWLIRVIAPSPAKMHRFRAFAVLLPMILWGNFFLLVRLNWGIIWPPTLWLGVPMMTGLSGLGLSVVMVPSSQEE